MGALLLPYLLTFELLGPLVEVAGLTAIAVGLALGVVNLPFTVLFLLIAVAYSLLVSLASLALEEFAFFRYRRWRDLAQLAAAALPEQFGFRQAHALWRLRGLARTVRGRRSSWGQPRRRTFDGSSGAPPQPAPPRRPVGAGR